MEEIYVGGRFCFQHAEGDELMITQTITLLMFIGPCIIAIVDE